MNLIQSNVKMMSSREIAELTGKQLSHVHRDFKKMMSDLGIDSGGLMPNPFMDQGFTYDMDGQNRISAINLNQELTLTLVSGYSAKLRNSIINRWQELEAKQVETPEQLMARALISAQSVIASKDAQIEAAQPAIRLESAICNDDSTLSMTEAGKKLQVKPRKFIEWLYKHKYIDASNMPYQRWINQGLLVISTIEKNGKPRSSTRVTGKGFAYFGGKLSELKFNNQQHFLFYK